MDLDDYGILYINIRYEGDKMTTTVKSIMKKPILLNENDNISDAIELFKTHNISGAPVVNNNNYFVGVVSEEDIIKTLITRNSEINIILPSPFDLIEIPLKTTLKLEEYRKDIENAMKTKISEIMVKDVITITPDTTINEASKIMVKNKVKRLPIVEDGGLVGIITRHDILEALC